MRFPNGYGSIIKLSGRRRKPYAVRVTDGYKMTGTDKSPRLVQKFRYLEYFEKKKDAAIYLANYNSGLRVKEHESLQDAPTFADVYERWMDEKGRSRRGLSDSLRASYSAAFRKYAAIHSRKIRTLRLSDLQGIIDDNRNLSESSVRNMIIVAHGMYKYAVRYDLVDSDLSTLLIGEGKEAAKIHSAFSDDEILTLWNHAEDEVAQFALITIYSGMRPGELLKVAPSDVDLEKGIIIGGSKTDAGKNRAIPLHKKIVPLIEQRMDKKKLFAGVSVSAFGVKYKEYMAALNMPHLPHDGRHTCATLMERVNIPLMRRKLILGHIVRDITEGIYTHVPPAELVAEINKIDV